MTQNNVLYSHKYFDEGIWMIIEEIRLGRYIQQFTRPVFKRKKK